MKITFEDADGLVAFRISEFDRKYEDILRACFYSPDGDSYLKLFPLNAKHLGKIKKHFYFHAQDMFDQLGYFAPIPWDKALFEFSRAVDGTGIKWWLAGSCAVCLRGIPLQPHDVDIMVESADVDLISDIFSDYLIEPIVDTEGWVTKDFGVIFRHARIDIASDPQAVLDDPGPIDCGPYARANLETVKWRGLKIMVPPLRLSMNANQRRGRRDRVEKILKHIHETSN